MVQTLCLEAMIRDGIASSRQSLIRDYRSEKGRAGTAGACAVLIATKPHPLHASQSSRID